ncbi:MAG: MBL fold metallo-hydrolase [Gammaproteobacteria bacterium]|nr:MBL fold metallo-hydrolase [Gammaproteobacteria bacterium]
MGYEVDIIGVGQESKSGDAIALRWGNLHGQREEQRVVIIDGGFRDSGQELVNHVTRYYGTDMIDAVISTHPDLDHISGLDVVLDSLLVRELWIHQPWKHNSGLAGKFMDGRVTDASIGNRLCESLDAASNLVAKA